MGNLTAIFIVGFIVLGIYKLAELFVRKKERLLILEKFSFLHENKENQGPIHLPPLSFNNPSAGFGTLRISFLLIGIGVGCLLSFFTRYALFDCDSSNHWRVNELEAFVTFSFIAIFGGAGLLASYLIEARKIKKDADSIKN
jgi:hypothetical protein